MVPYSWPEGALRPRVSNIVDWPNPVGQPEERVVVCVLLSVQGLLKRADLRVTCTPSWKQDPTSNQKITWTTSWGGPSSRKEWFEYLPHLFLFEQAMLEGVQAGVGDSRYTAPTLSPSLVPEEDHRLCYQRFPATRHLTWNGKVDRKGRLMPIWVGLRRVRSGPGPFPELEFRWCVKQRAMGGLAAQKQDGCLVGRHVAGRWIFAAAEDWMGLEE